MKSLIHCLSWRLDVTFFDMIVKIYISFRSLLPYSGFPISVIWGEQLSGKSVFIIDCLFHPYLTSREIMIRKVYLDPFKLVPGSLVNVFLRFWHTICLLTILIFSLSLKRQQTKNSIVNHKLQSIKLNYVYFIFINCSLQYIKDFGFVCLLL